MTDQHLEFIFLLDRDHCPLLNILLKRINKVYFTYTSGCFMFNPLYYNCTLEHYRRLMKVYKGRSTDSR